MRLPPPAQFLPLKLFCPTSGRIVVFTPGWGGGLLEVFTPDRESIMVFLSDGKSVGVFTAEGRNAEVFTPGGGVEVTTPDGKNRGAFTLSGKHMEVFTPRVWTISHHIGDYRGIHTRWRTMESIHTRRESAEVFTPSRQSMKVFTPNGGCGALHTRCVECVHFYIRWMDLHLDFCLPISSRRAGHR